VLTDIFLRRYQGVLEYDKDRAKRIVAPTLTQARLIFEQDVQPKLNLPRSFYRDLNLQLGRELSAARLWVIDADNQHERCMLYLSETPDFSWGNDAAIDLHCKTRLSLVELLFRNAEEYARRLPKKVSMLDSLRSRDWRKLSRLKGRNEALSVVRKATEELSARLQANGTQLVYHNGLIQIASDVRTTQRIAKPFWEIVADPKWKTVDHEMKEAFDHLDHGQRDAHAHAAMALESTIKIISDEKGWTRGNENGAANYIDHLVSANNGRFIEVWESEALKVLFRELRNPQSHGAGSNPPPRLLDAQQTWAIESCMSWIKSLVQRMP